MINIGPLRWEWSLEHVSLQERLAIYLAVGQGRLAEAGWQALVAGLHPDLVRRRLSGDGSRVDQVLALAHRHRALGSLHRQALGVVRHVAAWCAEGWGPLGPGPGPGPEPEWAESSSESSSPSPESTE